MNNLQTYYNASKIWSDATLLGNFIDNHDNARFLNYNDDLGAFKSALAFTLTSVGIPIVYYGDEQGYSGGNDPNNREPLWTNMNTNSDIYQFLTTVINFRKQNQIWNYPQVQRYSDNNFYAFTRGNFFFAFTNTQNNQERTIVYHPYSNDQVLCNIFYPTSDCITVQNGLFSVTLNNGEVKIYYPASSQSQNEYQTQSLSSKNFVEELKNQFVDIFQDKFQEKFEKVIVLNEFEVPYAEETEIDIEFKSDQSELRAQLRDLYKLYQELNAEKQ